MFTGGNTAGMAALAAIASIASPEDSRTSWPESTSVATHMKRDRCVLQTGERKVVVQQAAEPAVRDEVGALAEKPEQPGERAGGEHVFA